MLSPQQLLQFGLSEKEAKVYLSALSLGPASVQKIAEIADLHRVSTYDVIEGLLIKGFVENLRKGNKRLIAAIKPEKLMDALRQKERMFADLMPELKAIQNKENLKPKTQYFEGKDEVWEAYLKSMESKEIFCYGTGWERFDVYGNQAKNEHKLRSKSGIKVMSLVNENEKIIDKHDQIKILPMIQPFQKHTLIFSDKVLIIDWQNMYATIYEDSSNAENQRNIFKTLWEIAR